MGAEPLRSDWDGLQKEQLGSKEPSTSNRQPGGLLLIAQSSVRSPFVRSSEPVSAKLVK